jgi:hypothetical protein
MPNDPKFRREVKVATVAAVLVLVFIQPLGATRAPISTGYGDAHEMFGIAEGRKLDRAELRRVVMTLIERVELDPSTRKFLIHYQLPLTGARVASPRGSEPRSGGVILCVVSEGRWPLRAPRRDFMPAPA